MKKVLIWGVFFALLLCFLALPAAAESALVLYAPVLGRIRTLFTQTGAGEYADIVLRALGIALICELTAVFCRDLGENTLADGVQLFGKLEILVLSLPLVDKVLEMAKELLQY